MYNKTNMHRGRRSPIDKGACYNTVPRRNVCECEPVTQINGAPSLAMVYSVSQSWRYISDGCEGFDRGTIFDELYKPFFGDKCKCGGSCK